MSESKVGEAVLVLPRFDQKENLLPVFVKQIVVGVDLVIIGRRDDDADITDSQCFSSEFLEHDIPLTKLCLAAVLRRRPATTMSNDSTRRAKSPARVIRTRPDSYGRRPFNR